jgi:hypothetical protein
MTDNQCGAYVTWNLTYEAPSICFVLFKIRTSAVWRPLSYDIESIATCARWSGSVQLSRSLQVTCLDEPLIPRLLTKEQGMKLSSSGSDSKSMSEA